MALYLRATWTRTLLSLANFLLWKPPPWHLGPAPSAALRPALSVAPQPPTCVTQPGFSGGALFFFFTYGTVCKPVGDIRSCRYQYSRRATISQYTLSFAAPPPITAHYPWRGGAHGGFGGLHHRHSQQSHSFGCKEARPTAVRIDCEAL